MPRPRRTSARIISAATFIVLEVAALSMLSHSSSIQQQWMAEFSRTLTSGIDGSIQDLTGYFSLKKQNEKLAQENCTLKNELAGYREDFIRRQEEENVETFSGGQSFSFKGASVVKMSLNKQHNYFIIDKGRDDGIVPQSGVITRNGAIGIIDAVDSHRSFALSFMNNDISVSARIGHDGPVGALVWDGKSRNGALLKEIPVQYRFQPRDTIFTSGYSSIFPADIPLGVAGEAKVINGAINEIKVDLLEDYSSLRFVTVACNESRDEIRYLESMYEGEDDK